MLSRAIASRGPRMSELIRISDVAWHVRVNAGDQRGNIADFLTRGRRPTQQEREWIAEFDGKVEAPWQSIEIPQPTTACRAASTAPSPRPTGFISTGIAPFAPMSSTSLKDGAPDRHTRAMDGGHQSGAGYPDAGLPRRAGRGRPQADANLVRARHDLAVALGLMGFSIGLAALAVGIVLSRVIHPLRTMTLAIRGERDMARIAELAQRGDEIGQFAQALNVFPPGRGRPRAAGARAAAQPGGEGGGRNRQPRQVGIPGQYEPRTAHAVERGDRLFRDDAAQDLGAAGRRAIRNMPS